MVRASTPARDVGRTRPSLRSRVVTNSVVSAAGFATYLPIALLLNRYMVHRMGVSLYGIWAALSTLMAFSALLNLGVTAPVTKYAAEYIALDQPKSVNRLIATAGMFYLSASLIAAGAMVAGAGWILPHLLHQPLHNADVLRAYLLVAGGLVLILTFSPLESLLIGLQRADLNAQITLAVNIASAASTVAVLKAGLGLDGLAANWLVWNVLNAIALWVPCKMLLPSLRLGPSYVSRTEFRKIFAFSSRVQVASLSLFLNDQVDRVLIAGVLGTGPLGYYQLAARASQAISGVSFNVMAGSLAAASDIAALGDWQRLRAFYIRSTKYLTLIDVGACLALASLAGPLVLLWLGPGYGRVAATATIILAGYAIFLPNQATTNCLNAIGRPEIRMRADVAFLCIHIPLSLTLLWRFGFFGTVVGTAIAMSSTRLYVYWAGSRALGVPTRHLFAAALFHPFVGAILAGVAAFLLSSAVRQPLFALALGATGYGVVFAVYEFAFALDAYDRAFLKHEGRRITALLGKLR